MDTIAKEMSKKRKTPPFLEGPLKMALQARSCLEHKSIQPLPFAPTMFGAEVLLKYPVLDYLNNPDI